MLPTCFPHSPPRFPTVGSPIIASVRMKAGVIRLSPLEVIQQRASVAVLPWRMKRSHWKESQASSCPNAGSNPRPLQFKSNVYTTKPVKPQTPCLGNISDLFLFFFLFSIETKICCLIQMASVRGCLQTSAGAQWISVFWVKWKTYHVRMDSFGSKIDSTDT